MRDQFPGYIRKSPDEIVKIWKDCAFVLDANVLLNLYRYRPAITESFLAVLKKLQSRLWIPWQAAYEFHENRLKVINQQNRTYSDASELGAKLLRALEAPREHPFIDEPLLAKAKSTFTELKAFLAEKSNERRNLLISDPLLNQIAEMLTGRVGKEPTPEQRDERAAKAQRRCEQRVPPGFLDAK